MYYACNAEGRIVSIEEAEMNRKAEYFCHICGSPMIMKCGTIYTHHFAHKSNKTCDPWYTEDRMSVWHRNFQNRFPQSCQEVPIWDNSHTVRHVADVSYSLNGVNYVIEFQHSALSRDEFLRRSSFYLEQGYKLIWIFNFCIPKHEKRILYKRKDTNTKPSRISLVWPGKDRVRFLDYFDFDISMLTDPSLLHIFFHIRTCRGEEIDLAPYNGHPRSKWVEVYTDPFGYIYECCFVKPINFQKLDEFDAWYFGEEDFYDYLDDHAKKCINENSSNNSVRKSSE